MTRIDEILAKNLEVRPVFCRAEIMSKMTVLSVELAFNGITCKYEVLTANFPIAVARLWDRDFQPSDWEAARAHYQRALDFTLRSAYEGSL